MTNFVKTTAAALVIAVVGATVSIASDRTWEEDTLAYFASLLMNEIWSVDDTTSFEDIQQIIYELTSEDLSSDPFGEGDGDGC